MMDTQTADHKAQTKSMVEYAADLARSGVKVFPGGSGTIWTSYVSSSIMRRPTFHVGLPASGEVQRVLWRGWAAIASYLLEPDERHPANAWLYLCTDQTYSIEKLPGAARRNVRRGLKELKIAPLTLEQLLAHGEQSFCDTRRRNGLNDGTPEAFRQNFAPFINSPEYVFLGAWRDNQLAAFLYIAEVDDWAEIGACSADAMLPYAPNAILIFTALSHYLVERKFSVVSYGVSSIQAVSNAVGLHKFKTKFGFEARPVHRAFVPHPLLRPFINRLTLWGLNRLLQLRPNDSRLKRISGLLSTLLGNISIPEATESNTGDN